MARKKNFDDTDLQAALKGLKEEIPRDYKKAVQFAAVHFVELAKKRTKLASKAKIKRDYQKSGIGAKMISKEQPGLTRAEIRRAVELETAERIRAIGYQRSGWKITRISKRMIEIMNDSKNSRWVKNTFNAGRYAARKTLEEIRPLFFKGITPTMKKYSARKAPAK